MRVIKYEGECIENVEFFESYKFTFYRENCSYLAVMNDFQLNQQKNE